MFDEFRDKIIGIITSRLTVFTLLFALFGAILIYRCFDLQIVHGEEYLQEFVLEIEKTRDIASTRGKIFDRDGNVLAYNELAYSVKIEDTFESGRSKNAKLNDVVYRLIQMVEKPVSLLRLRKSMTSSAVAVRCSSFRSSTSATPYTSARNRSWLVPSTVKANSPSSFK